MSMQFHFASAILFIVFVIFGQLTHGSVLSESLVDKSFSRNLLQRRPAPSCNLELNVDWFGSSNNFGRFDIPSQGACCALCQRTRGCKAWVWRFMRRTCHLVYTVQPAKYCIDCRGGILESKTHTYQIYHVKMLFSLESPPPTPTDNIEETLEECRKNGETAALPAAIAACSHLVNVCPKAKPEVQRKAALQEGAELTAESISDDFLVDVINTSCRSVFINTCKREARNEAIRVNPECGALLKRGPEFDTVNCMETSGVNRIFTDEIDTLCVPDED